VLVLSTGDVLWFVDQALDAMVAMVEQLGDDDANARPRGDAGALPAANSPYAILTHCLGVMEFWGGSMVAGRAIERDRPAEFRAEGTVAELVAKVAVARRRLGDDLSVTEDDDDLRGMPDPMDAGTPYTHKGGVLVHILEELYQHLGQMELTRDILRGSPGAA
jgi:DinB superfamily